MKDHLKTVYQDDNVSKSNLKTEHMKRSKCSNKSLKGTTSMLPTKKNWLSYRKTLLMLRSVSRDLMFDVVSLVEH